MRFYDQANNPERADTVSFHQNGELAVDVLRVTSRTALIPV